MQIEETKNTPLERGFTITIPAAAIEEKLAERVRAMRPKVKLKGFRPGHVPEAHIRSQYGRELMEEVARELLETHSRELIETHKLKPADAPRAMLKTPVEKLLEGGEAMTCEIEIALTPEFELAELGDINLERPVAPLEDKDVDDALSAMAKAQKRFSPAEPLGVLAAGDMAVIDLIVQSEGRMIPGGKEKDFRIIIGDGRLPHGFESALIGRKTGEQAQAQVPFPENYPDKTLAGKQAIFSAAIRAVHKQAPAPNLEELAKASGCKSVAELKEKMRESMAASDKRMQRMHLHAALCQELARRHRFDMPEMLTQRLAEQMEAQGIEKSRARQQAETRLKIQFVLNALAEKHSIRAESAELRQAIIERIQQSPNENTRKQMQEYYQTRAGQTELLQGVLEGKILDFAVGKAGTSFRKITREALYTPPAG